MACRFIVSKAIQIIIKEQLNNNLFEEKCIMKLNSSSQVTQIKVVSNTHWDREFRHSFEKTRRNLLIMMDTTLDILENDPKYHSFTMDGHSIMIDDYLEMRPERTEQIKKFVKESRLIIGPYYTLPEQFTISHESLIRNLMLGKKTVEKYGGKVGTVAYTPSSWGQTGQYPQILADFGLTKMMFYRGISHHEAPAEYIWKAPDGTEVLASRFALYCRYNWYYQVHREVSRGLVWSKDYKWGKFDEVPFRRADGTVGGGVSYDLKAPEANYDNTNLKKDILDMLEEEKGHFTTPVFLGMNGHDISVAFPFESKVIEDVQKLFEGELEIEHTNLEGFWNEAEKYLDKDKMTVLAGERRSYLKEGKWTFLFPGTISARTYLKQADFRAYTNLAYYAEPLSSMAMLLGGQYSETYLERGWNYLISNHTHDANGGCAPDEVCKDMEYAFRKATDIGDIVSEDAMVDIAKNLSPNGQDTSTLQLIVYNTLPFERDAIIDLDLEIPASFGSGLNIEGAQLQPITSESSSVFVDSIWEVPTILNSTNHRVYAKLENIPAMGYKVFKVSGDVPALRHTAGIASDNSLENENLKVTVNGNGTINVLNKKTGKEYKNLNYFTSEGEIGNAWKHVSPTFDRKYNSVGVNARVSVTEKGPLVGSITAELDFPVPKDCEKVQSDEFVNIPVKVKYTLEENSDSLKVLVSLDNKAKDHWLRVNFPTALETDVSIADSHFDIVKRSIAIPDSTGWVEQAFGTHPLRTFATVTDGRDGLAVMPKGLFEYEVFRDNTMALTLIRSCRIKLAVSEEKMTELDDIGIQCPGLQTMEYSLNFYNGDYTNLANKAANLFAPVRCGVAGRGKGNLPLEGSVFSIDNGALHVTAIKNSEDNDGLIIRLYNPTDSEQSINYNSGFEIKDMYRCTMNEKILEKIHPNYSVPPKKILTVKVQIRSQHE